MSKLKIFISCINANLSMEICLFHFKHLRKNILTNKTKILNKRKFSG
jgi:hypothetical protein